MRVTAGVIIFVSRAVLVNIMFGDQYQWNFPLLILMQLLSRLIRTLWIN